MSLLHRLPVIGYKHQWQGGGSKTGVEVEEWRVAGGGCIVRKE